ncbi:unnamed protein product [Cyprideis torosa]|uniref:Uncharacterized protein n=1 Tax=Cyprideis torosa TaxID=163714 RepID=A0A7R8ZNK5_9CRUS|nr:unnamed protein product [Cyprideis torosa]CAG0886586.1 unnamed protein product [Cyprideis torosa]
MSEDLYRGLRRQGVVFNKGFNNLSRKDKLEAICQVFGVDYCDPDNSYELTYDNVMKMLAIQMRFRSQIPVVIMGETGSGKTRLIRFMCDLQKAGNTHHENMLILKTHGGIAAEDIVKKTLTAIKQASINVKMGIKQTVLFFDEANTTNAIGTIKSVMCDYQVDGKPIPKDIGLQFVAAVNPYREHSVEMIRKLESAGLGYHINAEKTADRIGKIPLRRLVYRVKEIPASMFPLVWDFGTLDSATEAIYIAQMIAQKIEQGLIPANCENVLGRTLSASQEFMRQQKDECSFVSLRDVERTLTVLEWFCTQERVEVTEGISSKFNADPFIVGLILALGVAYFVRLDSRDPYVKSIHRVLQSLGYQLKDHRELIKMIEACQDRFINELQLNTNIAKNDALKENVWMMAICIELKIPLFLVGKPGSSKSLAKTVVTDVMQGKQSYSELFKHFKEIHMVSFQCSPLATAGGILGTFRQCQKFQQDRDLSKFTSVVVLDEVGLAEDSDKMPLKTLHPLLEDGCVNDETPEPFKKVSFVGISNWALDPAKMNRGILVSRGVPTRDDLRNTAQDICANDKSALEFMRKAIQLLTDGYSHVYDKQAREYFGLRDFYSVVKMVFGIAQRQKRNPTEDEIRFAVQRNFGGYFGNFDPAVEFLTSVGIIARRDDMKGTSKDFILDAIRNDSTESRYILLLTKNNAALRIIQEQSLLDSALTIFGSSFPHDQEYTQICLNINRIKIAMELGQTVVLCNLTNLYESLYDALNQNYVMLGGKRYIDLGLGTHRVKCRVHEKFRLVVVAEDKEVYEKFPVPLINRLEKHFLGMETMLTAEQAVIVDNLKQWVSDVCHINIKPHESRNIKQYERGDVFIGYHEDVIASMVLRLVSTGFTDAIKIGDRIRRSLLQCATPDAISRLVETRLPADQQEEVFSVYHMQQEHSCLSKFLNSLSDHDCLVQVTTSSRLLTKVGKEEIARELDLRDTQITVLSLQQFDTEEQFTKRLRSFLDENGKQGRNEKQYLFVQVEIAEVDSLNLTECARYVVQDAIKAYQRGDDHNSFVIVFILQVPRVAGGCFTGLSVHPWVSCHIDELRSCMVHFADIAQLESETVPQLFRKGLMGLERLIVECLPKAASLVSSSDPSRMQKRVDLLMDLVERRDDNFGQEFLRVLTNVVIQKTDKKQGLTDKWLVRMAINSDHLKEGNTFQRSIWLHLSDLVIPILTEVITFCDVDRGLDIVTSDSSKSPILLKTSFLDILQATYQRDVKQDNLMSIGEAFESRFPFSRFLINLIETYQNKGDGISMSKAQLSGLMDTGQYGAILRKCFQDGDVRVVREYLTDFVHVRFPGLKFDDAKELMCQQLWNLARRELSIREPQEKMPVSGAGEEEADEDMEVGVSYITPVDIQVGYSNYKPRLHLLSSLCAFLPAIPHRLMSTCATSCEVEFNADTRGFFEALNFIEPKADLLDYDQRKLFFKHVDQLCSLFHQLTAMVQHLAFLELEQIGAGLKRLNIIKLYLQYICRGEQEVQKIVCTKVKRLNLMLKNNDLKSGKEFEKLIAFLRLLNEEVAKYHFSCGQDTCILCLEEMKNPVKLPGCGHLGCEDCLVEHFKMKERGSSRICPKLDCRKEVPNKFVFKSASALDEKLTKHKEFKQNLNSFFLDLLQRYVFKPGTNIPEPEVIEKLMSFVVTKDLPRDKSQKTMTKALSPFAGDCIDSSPIIRSFILQLLLQQYGEAFANLDTYLENERKQWTSEIGKHLELCLLVSFCLEDRLFMDDSGAVVEHAEVISPTSAVKFLKDCNFVKYESLAQTLAKVAKARLALQTVAKCRLKNGEKLVQALMPETPALAEITRSVLIERPDNLRQMFAGANTGRHESILLLLYQLRTSVNYLTASNIVKPLLAIVADPASVPYLPTMPQDDTVEVRHAAQGVTAWYECANGHQYGIGDCGQPSQQAKCPTCGAAIGGINYRFASSGLSAEQVAQSAAVDQTKTGYILGQAVANERSKTERSLSGLHVALTRFVLHACMALSCVEHGTKPVAAILDPKVSSDHIPGFLLDHLMLNIEQIAAHLGRNEDDAQVLLHIVIQRMFKRIEGVPAVIGLNTKKGRQEWEGAFARHVLNPEIAGLGEAVDHLTAMVADDQATADNELFAILNEKTSQVTDVTRIVDQPCFWIPREKISLDSLPYKVGQERLKRRCPNFSRFVTNELVLSRVGQLPGILRMHTIFMRKLGNRVDSAEVSTLSIRSFVNDKGLFIDEVELRTEMRNLIDAFMATFNSLKDQLPSVGKVGEQALMQIGGKHLTEDSSAGVLFPSTHPLGQCSIALVQVLIKAHNDMLLRHVEENGLDKPSSVPPMELPLDQLVRFDKKELHLLLLVNSEYSLEVAHIGKHTQWKLNENGLESAVIERFLVGRPLIDANQVPRFHFQNDKIQTTRLSELIPQDCLLGSLRLQLDTELKKLPDVCDLLSIAETTRDFLLITGGPEGDSLFKRMKDLRLKPKVAVRALKQMKLQHLDDLIDCLQLMRSRRMVLNKQDPFNLMPEEYRVPIDDKLLSEALPQLLKSFHPDVVLAKLHGFIVHRLSASGSQTGWDPPAGVLSDYIGAQLEANDDKIAPDFARAIHKQLMIMHAVDLFVQLVTKYQQH